MKSNQSREQAGSQLCWSLFLVCDFYVPDDDDNDDDDEVVAAAVCTFIVCLSVSLRQYLRTCITYTYICTWYIGPERALQPTNVSLESNCHFRCCLAI